jgi:hypothetical protein
MLLEVPMPAREQNRDLTANGASTPQPHKKLRNGFGGAGEASGAGSFRPISAVSIRARQRDLPRSRNRRTLNLAN